MRFEFHVTLLFMIGFVFNSSQLAFPLAAEHFFTSKQPFQIRYMRKECEPVGFEETV